MKTYNDARNHLRSTVPGFEERPQQDQLARAIERAWTEGTITVAEAPTGVGKSYAALVPSLLQGGRTIYSTGTKVLQDQVITKDLPFLQANLPIDFTYAPMYGRRNMACHVAVGNAMQDGDKTATDLWEILKAEDEGQDGAESWDGRRETLDFEVDDFAWMDLTVDSESCQRKQCPFYEQCRYYRHKSQAMSADLVVVNHALLSLDMMMSMIDGGHPILGSFDRLVIDECHEMEDWVTKAMEVRQTHGTYASLRREITANAPDLGDDMADEARTLAVELTTAAGHMFKTLVDQVDDNGRIHKHHDLSSMETVLEIARRLADILEDHPILSSDDPRTKLAWKKRQSRVLNICSALSGIIADSQGWVSYIEVTPGKGRGGEDFVSLFSVPISIADITGEHLFNQPTVLMSATVLVNGKSDYVAEQLGLDQYQTVEVSSPFDYTKNSLLYIPSHLPLPSGKTRGEWSDKTHRLVAHLVEMSQGHALLLYTSRSEMEAAYRTIQPRLRNLGIPCKKQGDATTAALGNWKREVPEGVLFATRSFFTGFSAEGDAVQLVVIDKLPFPVPTDPLFEARSELIDERHGPRSSFMKLSVPMMTLPLKQAAGRLIRTKTDRGVIVITDPRLISKSYGKAIMRSLAPPVTTTSDAVSQFFGQEPAPSTPAPVATSLIGAW